MDSFAEILDRYQKGEFPLFDSITPWHDTHIGFKNQFVTDDGSPLFNYDLYGWVLLNEPIDKINRFIDHYLGMDYFQPNMVMGICSCLDETCGGSDASCTKVNKFLKEHNRMDMLPIVNEYI
jgi:hypothetical protein